MEQVAFGELSIRETVWKNVPTRTSQTMLGITEILPQGSQAIGEKYTDPISLANLSCARHCARPGSTGTTCKAQLVPGALGQMGKRVSTSKRGADPAA